MPAIQKLSYDANERERERDRETRAQVHLGVVPNRETVIGICDLRSMIRCDERGEEA